MTWRLKPGVRHLVSALGFVKRKSQQKRHETVPEVCLGASPPERPRSVEAKQRAIPGKHLEHRAHILGGVVTVSRDPEVVVTR
jgi:hypothetical protein